MVAGVTAGKSIPCIGSMIRHVQRKEEHIERMWAGQAGNLE